MLNGTTVAWLAAAGSAWVAWALVCRWVMNNPREELVAGLLYRFMQVYARVVHRLRVTGLEHVPRGREPGKGRGGLIVVANHTAGVDPVLIQSVCEFEVRWMMARDMMSPRLGVLWEWGRVIAVERGGGDSRSAREALRHLQGGGVLGVFPEGGIERPARQIRPFLAGIGLFVAKTGACVLPVAVMDTPESETAWGSLMRRSRARLIVLPMVDYRALGVKPSEIAGDLRERLLAATGWERNDEPLELG